MKRIFFLIIVCCVIMPSHAKIGIIINRDLYPYINQKVSSYINDLQTIENKSAWLDATTFGASGSIDALRDSLRNHHTTDSLEGVLLIGDLPIAEYEVENDHGRYGYERFPTDLFYMDLDGVWQDTARDGAWAGYAKTGVFDGHTGAVAMEIWVSRLLTSVLPDYGDQVDIVKKYFDRVHNRMIGNETMPSRVLSFGNTNDWPSFNTSMVEQLGYDQQNTVAISRPGDTRDAWMAQLRGGFEYANIFEHSTPTYHCTFGEGFSSEDYIGMTNTAEGGSDVRFYNLFACSNSRYTERNYFGGLYAFGHRGLMSIGTTKTGSMLRFYDYNSHLSEGVSFGEAFKRWVNTWIGNAGSDIWLVYWHYGMTMMGAGTLKMQPYPAIETFTIESSCNFGGIVDPLGVCTVVKGGSLQFQFHPKDYTHVSHVYVDGIDLGMLRSYSFNDVNDNHTLLVLFDVNRYTITASAGVNGSITPNGIDTLNQGDSQSYTITPAAGYVIDQVVVDDVPVGAMSSYSFENVSRNHTIVASFKAGHPAWTSGIWYAVGSVVNYQGVLYKCRQGHTSQQSWTPPATPALWLRL